MQLIKALAFSITLGAVALVTSGCGLLLLGAGAAAGGAAVAYAKGNLESEESVGFNRVRDSAQRALEDRGYTVTKNTLTEKQVPVKETQIDPEDGDVETVETERTVARQVAQLVAKDAEGNDITIDIEEMTDSRTKLSIRHGVFGDEEKSTDLLQDIRRSY